ncbi:hypothetical protein V5799_028378 [Amblyomma americanum]|uniref:Uncharacterized protein n=1 Tax=Amblyomma americanum TaxID=6943 RepID=A0AAQ4DD14_AMBAM
MVYYVLCWKLHMVAATAMNRSRSPARRSAHHRQFGAGHAPWQEPQEPGRLEPPGVSAPPPSGGGGAGRRRRLPVRQGATGRRAAGQPCRRAGRIRGSGGAAARLPGRKAAGAAVVVQGTLRRLRSAADQRRQERSDDGRRPSGLHPEPEPAVDEEPAGSPAAPVRERPEAVIPRNRVEEDAAGAPTIFFPRTAPAAPFSPARHGPFF